jgi:hypothetical protein
MASQKLRRLLSRPAAVIAAASFLCAIPGTARATLPPGTAVQQWNAIAEDTVVGSGAFQNEGLIYMAYVSLAVYNAAVAVEGGYEPYGIPPAADAGASLDAAVVEAAYTTLRHYFPARAHELDALHTEALGLIASGGAKEEGRATGIAAAEALIQLRTGDGLVTPIASTSVVTPREAGPGTWRLTPLAFLAPQTPWVGAVHPFVLNTPDQFHLPGPPPLTSQRWVHEFDEVKVYGAASSRARTDEETAIARFWTANVIRQYNQLGRDLSSDLSLDLLETARLLAMINVVAADAQISVMHWKYAFLFWRPVTAIDPLAVVNDGFGPVPGFDDGNDLTVEEPGWRPLIGTPNHPEYPGAHGSITSAVAEVLTEFLGSIDIDVKIHGFDPSGAPGNLMAIRHFDTAEQLREEIVNARLWAGLHYRESSEAGVDLGRKVAHYDLNHAFRPIPGH